MKKVLIAYFPFGETPKVAERFGKLFLEKGINSETYIIEDKNLFNLKQQFKKEKQLELKKPFPNLSEYSLIIVGTPVASFSSAPIVNHFLKTANVEESTRVILYATGIGLPGTTIKKMKSLLSMKNVQVLDSQVFSSIFPFDSRKLQEVNVFFEKVIKLI